MFDRKTKCGSKTGLVSAVSIDGVSFGVVVDERVLEWGGMEGRGKIFFFFFFFFVFFFYLFFFFIFFFYFCFVVFLF